MKQRKNNNDGNRKKNNSNINYTNGNGKIIMENNKVCNDIEQPIV